MTMHETATDGSSGFRYGLAKASESYYGRPSRSLRRMLGYTRVVCDYLCERVPRRTVNEAAGNV